MDKAAYRVFFTVLFQVETSVQNCELSAVTKCQTEETVAKLLKIGLKGFCVFL